MVVDVGCCVVVRVGECGLVCVVDGVGACCRQISECGGIVYGGVGRFVVGIFGKMYIRVGECGLVCVLDGVWCML